MKTFFCLSLACALLPLTGAAQRVDYSVLYVSQESGTEFTKITDDGDYVCMPKVKREWRGDNISWYSNKVIDVSPDGKNIAFLSARNNTSNIFIKKLSNSGGSVQRTNRQNIQDFSFSPDGQNICFSERDGRIAQIYQTSAISGYVCRQITNNAVDFMPVYSENMEQIFFTRQERNSTSIWSYNLANNYLSNYTRGMNPYPLKGNGSMLCVRSNSEGRGEIWRVDINRGTEECLLSDPVRSFSSPSLSPNGKWILLVGSSVLTVGKKAYANTDVFVCKTDGTDLRQLTYHAADDLSPVWDKSGRYVYFISQRGSAEGTANIWRMTFDF